jgi:hypothetical protein
LIIGYYPRYDTGVPGHQPFTAGEMPRYRRVPANTKVRKTPRGWPRSWANSSILLLYFHRFAWPTCIFWASLTALSPKVEKLLSGTFGHAILQPWLRRDPPDNERKREGTRGNEGKREETILGVLQNYSLRITLVFRR